MGVRRRCSARNGAKWRPSIPQSALCVKVVKHEDQEKVECKEWGKVETLIHTKITL